MAVMAETLHEQSPPPPPDARRLVRDRDEKVLAGVCAAFGRYTDTDPVLWRVTIAVLTLFGGAGLALYALAWLLVPERGQRQSLAERTLRGPDRGLTVGGIALLVVGGLVLVALLDNGPGLPALLVLGGIVYLVARERRENPLPPAPERPAEPGDTLITPVPYGPPPLWPEASWQETSAAPQPRERSPLGGTTLSIAAVLAGVLLALSLAGVDALTPPRIVAAALLVVGLGLLVGSWYGRARWLIPVGLLLVLGLAVSAAAQELDVKAGVGERTWVAQPVPDQSFALGAGEATLDLRGLDAGDEADITASIGAGHLIVLVPADLAVAVDSTVDIGEISYDDRTLDDGRDLAEEFLVGRGTPGVQLSLNVRFGEIEVRRVAS